MEFPRGVVTKGIAWVLWQPEDLVGTVCLEIAYRDREDAERWAEHLNREYPDCGLIHVRAVHLSGLVTWKPCQPCAGHGVDQEFASALIAKVCMYDEYLALNLEDGVVHEDDRCPTRAQARLI